MDGQNNRAQTTIYNCPELFYSADNVAAASLSARLRRNGFSIGDHAGAHLSLPYDFSKETYTIAPAFFISLSQSLVTTRRNKYTC